MILVRTVIAVLDLANVANGWVVEFLDVTLTINGGTAFLIRVSYDLKLLFEPLIFLKSLGRHYPLKQEERDYIAIT
jgi:hypothetical protein